MRAIGTALVAMAMSVAVVGCNLILDNDVHELGKDASSGSGGAGGLGGSGGQGGDAGQGGSAGQGGAGQGGAAGGSAGQGGDAGQGGAAGGGGAGRGGAAGQSGAGQGGAAGQGGIAGRDASTGDDGAAGSVNRDGSIGGDTEAGPLNPDATMSDVADDASCSTPGATECRGRSVYVCIAGMWIETQKCPYACVINVCSGNCVPGTTQCTGNTPQTCDATGTWQNGTVCSYVCSQGACTGMCVPGTTVPCGNPATCNDGAVQTCDFAGTLGACNPAPSNCEIIPAGWQPVAKPPSSCPSGFGFAQTVYTSASGAPYTCVCGCGGAQSCAGSVTLNESTSCAGIVMGTRSIAIATTCTASYVADIVQGNGYSLSDVAFEPSPACGANPTPTTQPPAQTTTATLCTPTLTCPSGACLSPSQAANLCIAKQGMEACPQGYPNGTTLAPWYDDTRSCGACTCGSSLTCILNSVQLNNLTTCSTMGHMFWMNATTSCTQGPSNFPVSGVKADATSTGNASCVETAPSNPMGSVQLNQGTISTVCCK